MIGLLALASALAGPPTAEEARAACLSAGRTDCEEVASWFAPPSDAPPDELGAACDAGSGPACWELALRLPHGPEAVARTRRACELGVDKACQDLWALTGEDPTDLRGRNAARLEASCLSGEAWACRDAPGWMQLAGLPAERVEAVAARGCALGDGPSCYAAGLRRLARGDRAACREGLALLRSACAAGDPDACADLRRVAEQWPACRRAR